MLSVDSPGQPGREAFKANRLIMSQQPAVTSALSVFATSTEPGGSLPGLALQAHDSVDHAQPSEGPDAGGPYCNSRALTPVAQTYRL